MRGAIEQRRARPETRGFTLLEMAVAMAVAGLIGVGALYIFRQAEQREHYDATLNRMDIVVKALATYVDSAGRLPCPADPGRNDALFGWEWGVTQATVNSGRPVPPTTCRQWSNPVGAANPQNMGIVPFLTLGLSADDVRDGWGNYFTYAVSPVFAQNNDDTNATGTGEDTGNIHVRCLDESWYDNHDGTNNDIISGPRAKFCCAKDGNAGNIKPDFKTNTDIQMQFRQTNGTVRPLWPDATDTAAYNDVRDARNTHYFPIKSLLRPGAFMPLSNTNPTTGIAAVAFVLISHGDNGLGAFLGNGSRAKMTGGTPGAGEIQNGAGTAGANRFDRTFVTGPRNMVSGNNHFDDIVVWRTQEGIMAETGALSCRYP